MQSEKKGPALWRARGRVRTKGLGRFPRLLGFAPLARRPD
jgi:hypothetical protein